MVRLIISLLLTFPHNVCVHIIFLFVIFFSFTPFFFALVSVIISSLSDDVLFLFFFRKVTHFFCTLFVFKEKKILDNFFHIYFDVN